MWELFENVLSASFYGSIVIAVILVLRFILKKAPKKYICLLWLLAAVRLLVPLEIQSGFSLLPELNPVEQKNTGYVQENIAPLPADTVNPAPVVPAIPDSLEYPEDLVIVTQPNGVTMESDHTVYIGKIFFAWGWLAVAAGMLVYSGVSYLHLCYRVRDAVILAEGVWVCPKLSSAFVLGFFRPQIYLNPGLSDGEREFVLWHERCHIRRLDHWWKPLGYLALCIHWFNPLVWLGYILLCRDLEMACDEAVVKGMDTAERKAYSAALLSCAAGHRAIAACPVAFGEVSVKERIKNVLNYRKPKFWIVLVSVVVVIVVAVCFLTSPVEKNLLRLAGVPENRITEVGLKAEPGMTSVSREDELAEIKEILGEIQYAPEPIQDDTSEIDPWTCYWINLYCGERAYNLYFSEDYSTVWAEADGERTAIYSVSDPTPLRELVEKLFTGVSHREASGEAFSTAEDVFSWTSQVDLASIEEAKYYREIKKEDGSGVSSTGGPLREYRFEEFLEVLNTVPKDAFVPQQTLHIRGDSPYTASDIRCDFFPSEEGASLTIWDGVNDNIIVFRYFTEMLREEEILELAVIEDVEDFEADASKLASAYYWRVESDALLSVMREFTEHSASIVYWGGYWDGSTGAELPENTVLSAVSGKVFTYEKEGFGGSFTITLNADGSFQYYEGMLSSYIGMGTWSLDGDLLCLAENKDTTYGFVNYFRVEDGTLVFRAEGSDNFLYVDVADGERFLPSGNAPIIAVTEQNVLDMCIAAYNELHNAQSFAVNVMSGEMMLDSVYHIAGENYYITDLENLDYFTLVYNGEVYCDIYYTFAEEENIPSGWVRGEWLEENYDVILDSEREPFVWEIKDWEALGLDYTYLEQRGDVTILEFAEKENPRNIWIFAMDKDGNLDSITYAPEGRMEKQWVILGVDQSFISDWIQVQYAKAYREIPDVVIVRDDAFYQELFTRRPDGAYSPMWTSDLFEAFYAEPEDFVNRLSTKYSEDPQRAEEVISQMIGYEFEYYEPERFAQILAELRDDTNVDQNIVALLEARYQEIMGE